MIPGSGSEGYVLDGFGGIHPVNGAPAATQIGNNGAVPWPGWDIARSIAVTGVGKGYVLDGYGGVHNIGNAPALSTTAYWGGWDIARGIVVNSTCTGGYVLDGYGGVHSYGAAAAVATTAYWGGWDIARGLTLVTNTSGYVLDGYGNVHPFAANGTPMPRALSNPGVDGASTVPFDGVAYNSAGASALVITKSNANEQYSSFVAS